ncbi:MAG: NAD(P)H-dependent oxidoreductase subunit E [Chloroflexota bacterium]|nr:MAG: NAD(P)H-dependent oxidoreductase subunit E [Chloroflexota bacterium]
MVIAEGTAAGSSTPIEQVLAGFRRDRADLIAILHAVQNAFGYISRESVEAIGAHVELTPAQVYGVLTFYDHFRTKPLGTHLVELCVGPACYVRGGAKIRRVVETILGIEEGETTPDGSISLRGAQCTGTCALAPMIHIDGKQHGHLRLSDVPRLLAGLREAADPADRTDRSDRSANQVQGGAA